MLIIEQKTVSMCFCYKFFNKYELKYLITYFNKK